MRIKTPHHRTPEKMVPALVDLVKRFQAYDHVSIGFPGYVRGRHGFHRAESGHQGLGGLPLEAAMKKS